MVTSYRALDCAYTSDDSSCGITLIEFTFLLCLSRRVSKESSLGTVSEFRPAYRRGAAKKRNKAETGMCKAYAFLGKKLTLLKTKKDENDCWQTP
mmetsp:Transcript_19962/g.37275  ORF Transcript_19962/g.37275 Transcript_19962/m.37275 type:complete len:95 (+) Transcript_19962:129-413(+)